jgi:hypothetical protein
VAEGNSFVAGREIGLLELVGQAYGIVGRYYQHLGNPEGRRDMTPFNYLAAAAFVPLCIAGAPLAVLMASWFVTSGISRMVSRGLTRAELPIASRTCAARATPEQSEDWFRVPTQGRGAF